jgi:hypothetical protein
MKINITNRFTDTMKIFFLRIVLLLILFPVTFILNACHQTAEYRIEKGDAGVVQVHLPVNIIGDNYIFESVGIVLGDGSQIVTIINYESYNPGTVKVIAPQKGVFTASIQTIDTRTGLTLLKLNDATLPSASIGDTSIINKGKKVDIRAWDNDNSVFRTRRGIVVNVSSSNSTFAFDISLDNRGIGWTGGQGALVTDLEGNILGIEGIYSYRINERFQGQGRYIPPIIKIERALELTNCDDGRYMDSFGPMFFAYKIAQETGYMYGDFNGLVFNYSAIAGLIDTIVSNPGKPVDFSDLPVDIGTISPAIDGSVFIAVYPEGTNIHTLEGTMLPRIKWAGIQWKRDDKQQRMFVGTDTYQITECFEIELQLINELELEILKTLK